MDRNWNDFLAPYEQAVSELKVKLRGIRKQFRDQKQHVPIEFVTGRVKPVESILAKSQLRGIPLDRLEEEMSDIAGLRMGAIRPIRRAGGAAHTLSLCLIIRLCTTEKFLLTMRTAVILRCLVINVRC